MIIRPCWEQLHLFHRRRREDGAAPHWSFYCFPHWFPIIQTFTNDFNNLAERWTISSPALPSSSLHRPPCPSWLSAACCRFWSSSPRSKTSDRTWGDHKVESGWTSTCLQASTAVEPSGVVSTRWRTCWSCCWWWGMAGGAWWRGATELGLCCCHYWDHWTGRDSLHQCKTDQTSLDHFRPVQTSSVTNPHMFRPA